MAILDVSPSGTLVPQITFVPQITLVAAVLAVPQITLVPQITFEPLRTLVPHITLVPQITLLPVTPESVTALAAALNDAVGERACPLDVFEHSIACEMSRYPAPTVKMS